MKLRFIWIGKTRNAPIRHLIAHYLERIARFVKYEVIELKDKNESGTNPGVILEKEAEDILPALDDGIFAVVLDEKGTGLSSAGFSKLIEEHMVKGTKKIGFIIGSHYGVAESIKERADFSLSLSQMTFTHEMARVMLLEQVYRAFTIIKDLPYQK